MTAHGRASRDDRLERRQVELAQRALVDLGVEGEALGLGVVGDEVLDRRADALGLQPAHVGGADARGQQRVLAEALEVPAAVGRAVQVDGRREQHVDALAPALRGRAAARGARSAPRPTSPPARWATGRWRRARARPSARRARRPGRRRSRAARRPAAGSAYRVQKSAPVSRRTFCSRVSAASRSRGTAPASSIVLIGPSMGPRLSPRPPAPASGSTRAAGCRPRARTRRACRPGRSPRRSSWRRRPSGRRSAVRPKSGPPESPWQVSVPPWGSPRRPSSRDRSRCTPPRT